MPRFGIRHFVTHIADNQACRYIAFFAKHSTWTVVVEGKITGNRCTGFELIVRVKSRGKIRIHITQSNPNAELITQFARITTVNRKFIGIEGAQRGAVNVREIDIPQRKITHRNTDRLQIIQTLVTTHIGHRNIGNQISEPRGVVHRDSAVVAHKTELGRIPKH